MSLKRILVHLDSSEPCQARLDLAIGYAAKHQARLTAVHACCQPYYALGGQSRQAGLAEQRGLFEQKTAAAGIAAHWIHADKSRSSSAVIEDMRGRAYFADLVVVGQADPASGNAAPGDMPERLVFGTGRPVLIVPYAGRFVSFGERVMLAWKNGREAARAAHDALPLMRGARQVNVLDVGAPGRTKRQQEDCCAEICSYLDLHGVRARSEHVVAAEVGTGDALLNRAAEEGTDLMVLGAFADARLGEVARHLLRHMTVPVLMSH